MEFSSFFNYPTEEPDIAAWELVFLPNTSEEDWQKIIAASVRRKCSQGEEVVCAGDASRDLFIIISGRLEVLVAEGRKGTSKHVAFMETGSVFGEQAFVDGLARSASIRAVVDSEVLQLSLDSFNILAAKEPQLAKDMLFDLCRILSLRLRKATTIISDFVG